LPGRLSILLASLLLLCAGISASGSYTLLDDTLDISVGHYRFAAFRINPSQAEGTGVRGFLQITPDTTSIELILLHVDDFDRWATSGENVDTLSYIRTLSDSFYMPVSGIGDYRLVISNRGNYHETRVVAGAAVSFIGSGVEEDPLIFAVYLALALMALTAVIILIVAVVKTARRRRR
jgi:hypothetical protein